MATPSLLATAIRDDNNLETIKKLIENGASVNEFVDFEYPLDIAVDRNNVEIVTFLLTCIDYNISDTFDGAGRNLLHRACEAKSGSVEIVRCLLEHGISVNSENIHGDTSLHLACITKNKDVVQLLIDFGVNVNYVSVSRCAPIFYAISKYSTEILELLLKNGAEIFSDKTMQSLLHSAMCLEARDATKLLLGYTVKLSSQTEINWNTLSCAVFEKNFNLVKELLENGLEIDILCLYTAVVCGSNEILELIWQNIVPDVVSKDLYFMIHVFDNFKYNERITKLWVLLNKEDVDLHLERCGKAFSCFIYRTAEKFTGARRSELNELLQCLQRRGLHLCASDTERIISLACFPSYTDIVEDIITIILPKITGSTFVCANEFGMDTFLFQYCMDVNIEMLFKERMFQCTADSMQRYLGLFTLTNAEKNLIFGISEENNVSEQLDDVSRMLLTANFKSLVELSRNAVRKQLNEICTDSRHLLHILDQLQLPSMIRDIIQCKAPVNLCV